MSFFKRLFLALLLSCSSMQSSHAGSLTSTPFFWVSAGALGMLAADVVWAQKQYKQRGQRRKKVEFAQQLVQTSDGTHEPAESSDKPQKPIIRPKQQNFMQWYRRELTSGKRLVPFVATLTFLIAAAHAFWGEAAQVPASDKGTKKDPLSVDPKTTDRIKTSKPNNDSVIDRVDGILPSPASNKGTSTASQKTIPAAKTTIAVQQAIPLPTNFTEAQQRFDVAFPGVRAAANTSTVLAQGVVDGMKTQVTGFMKEYPQLVAPKIGGGAWTPEQCMCVNYVWMRQAEDLEEIQKGYNKDDIVSIGQALSAVQLSMRNFQPRMNRIRRIYGFDNAVQVSEVEAYLPLRQFVEQVSKDLFVFVQNGNPIFKYLIDYQAGEIDEHKAKRAGISVEAERQNNAIRLINTAQATSAQHEVVVGVRAYTTEKDFEGTIAEKPIAMYLDPRITFRLIIKFDTTTKIQEISLETTLNETKEAFNERIKEFDVALSNTKEPLTAEQRESVEIKRRFLIQKRLDAITFETAMRDQLKAVNDYLRASATTP